MSLHPKIKSKLKRRGNMLWQQALRNPSTFAWKLVLHARVVEVKSLGITLRNRFSHRAIYSLEQQQHWYKYSLKERVWYSFPCSYGITTLFLLLSCSINADSISGRRSSCFLILEKVFSLKRTIMCKQATYAHWR